MLMLIKMLIKRLDAEKAFDRVLWPFIFETCEAYCFNQRLIKLVKKNIQSTKCKRKDQWSSFREICINDKTRRSLITFDLNDDIEACWSKSV